MYATQRPDVRRLHTLFIVLQTVAHAASTLPQRGSLCQESLILQVIVWVLITIVQTLPMWQSSEFFRLEGRSYLVTYNDVPLYCSHALCFLFENVQMELQYRAYTKGCAFRVQVMTPAGFGWLLRQQQEVQSGRLHCTGQVAVLQRPIWGRCLMPVDYHNQQLPWLGMTKPCILFTVLTYCRERWQHLAR